MELLDNGLFISVSELKVYTKCPEKFRLGEFLSIQKKRLPDAREFGSCFHKGAEVLAERGLDAVAEATAEVLTLHAKQWADFNLDNPELEKQYEDETAWLERVFPLLAEMWRERGIAPVVQEAEKEHRLKLGNHIIVGRPDAVVAHNGLLWHRQLKTSAATVSVTNNLARYALDWHEAVYIMMLRQDFNLPVVGTELTVARKVKLHNKSKPEQVFYRDWILRGQTELDETLSDIQSLCDTIHHELSREAKRPGGRLPRNPQACVDWNRTCDFLNVCRGTLAISDGTLDEAGYELKAGRYDSGAGPGSDPVDAAADVQKG